MLCGVKDSARGWNVGPPCRPGGKNPDPQNNISGPYEIIVEQGGRIERVFPVNAFDMIDT